MKNEICTNCRHLRETDADGGAREYYMACGYPQPEIPTYLIHSFYDTWTEARRRIPRKLLDNPEELRACPTFDARD